MWIVVYIAQLKEQAEKIRDLLKAADVLVKIRAVNQSDNEKYGCYEILVPESEVPEAHDIIISNLF